MKWLVALVLLPILLALAPVLLNRPPLFDPPGVWQRLRIFFATNVAETRPGHPRPELRPRVYALPVERLRQHAREAVTALGWGEVHDRDGVLHLVVETRLMSFKDDVEVRFEPEGDGVRVEVRSASRVGRADFGANTRHVLDLYAELEWRLESP